MNEPDTFEISLRLLGNEVIGMKLNSQSKARNWIVLAMICLVIIATTAAQIIPVIQGVNL
jgi:hypothetical protein